EPDLERTTMTATCPNGHELAEATKFCPQCGTQVLATSATSSWEQAKTGSNGAPVGPPLSNGTPFYPPPAFPPSYPPPAYPPTYPPYPGPSMAAPTRATNGMSIASLVLGILWLWGIGSILALIFGYIGLRQTRERNENGRGMAIAGVVLGWVGVAVTILVIVLAIVASASSGGS